MNLTDKDFKGIGVQIKLDGGLLKRQCHSLIINRLGSMAKQVSRCRVVEGRCT